MKTFVIIFIALFAMVSCTPGKKSEVQKENVPATASSLHVITYEGVLPCADCPGIKTKLEINPGDGTMENYTFVLTRTYLNREPDNVFVEKGNYNLERGFDDDNDATVYVLNWDKNKEEQEFFVRFSGNDSTLVQLSTERKLLDTNLHSLKKQ